MIKLIAIDMDGTLLNSKKQLLEETKQYFKEFHYKDTETLLVLCTGRPETGIRPYLKDLGYLEECTAPQKLDIKNLTFGVFFNEINL